MEDNLPQIVELAIELENAVADLYMLFHEIFPEDADFWLKLFTEEREHASLLKWSKDLLESTGEFPYEIVPADITPLTDSINKVKTCIRDFSTDTPTREAAFLAAIEIEESAGEVHFQEAMGMKADSTYLETFQKLNLEDKDHAARIRSYMQERLNGSS
jgi:hypothetical protein